MNRRQPFGVRMPKQLHDQLKESSSVSKRSLNSETVLRLERSFRADQESGLVADLERALADSGWGDPLSVDLLKMFMDGWEKARCAGLLPDVSARPAGAVAKHAHVIGELSVKLDALKDFTGGGVVHAQARRLGASRHDINDSESVARTDGTLLDYFQQYPGWEGFLGAMGEAFMREYSARTDEQAGHYAGMMAALSVARFPKMIGSGEQKHRAGAMACRISSADFELRNLTITVDGEMSCTDGRYLLIPEAADGK
ncbi:hypothetical protein TUM18999_57740 [Pseudomonas tohonis]|uniref:Arc-like DNA binding domain-containing protein n=1 Tax=Pseudomonas tohonis TaxID=2725477 RepID=A0A6J4ECD7_9PSED|nr:Arc family DNA-binding protein [Pseudomonas tohonis]BCG27583.1 hypothetical protein TUM18999_57740 [Pseudomonas tohonis]